MLAIELGMAKQELESARRVGSGKGEEEAWANTMLGARRGKDGRDDLAQGVAHGEGCQGEGWDIFGMPHAVRMMAKVSPPWDLQGETDADTRLTRRPCEPRQTSSDVGEKGNIRGLWLLMQRVGISEFLPSMESNQQWGNDKEDGRVRVEPCQKTTTGTPKTVHQTGIDGRCYFCLAQQPGIFSWFVLLEMSSEGPPH